MLNRLPPTRALGYARPRLYGFKKHRNVANRHTGTVCFANLGAHSIRIGMKLIFARAYWAHQRAVVHKLELPHPSTRQIMAVVRHALPVVCCAAAVKQPPSAVNVQVNRVLGFPLLQARMHAKH